MVARMFLWIRDLLDPAVNFEEVSVLCYHSVSDASSDTVVSKNAFERHLALLKKSGMSIVPLSDVVAWVRGEKTLPRKAVALTFDDGYADFETTVVPILERYQASATVFVVGDESAARACLGNDTSLLSGEAIERLRANPLIEVGYHSRTHANLAKLSGEALKREVGQPEGMNYFAYPGGNHSPDATRTIREAGYQAAFSIHPGLVRRASDRFLMPRNVILNAMPLWQVRVRATKAIDWYRFTTRCIKKL